MEKQIREIIAQHVGGTYEAKQKCAEDILRLFSVVGRSEQLKAFQGWQLDKGYLDQKKIKNGMVDEYLKSL